MQLSWRPWVRPGQKIMSQASKDEIIYIYIPIFESITQCKKNMLQFLWCFLHCGRIVVINGHHKLRPGSTKRWWVATMASAVKSLLPAAWLLRFLDGLTHAVLEISHQLGCVTCSKQWSWLWYCFVWNSFENVGKTPFYSPVNHHLPFIATPKHDRTLKSGQNSDVFV